MKIVRKFSVSAIVSGLLLGLLILGSPVFADDGVSGNPPSERLLVKFQSGTSWIDRAAVHKRAGGKIESILPGIGVEVVTVPAGLKSAKLASYRMFYEVSSVEVDSVAQAIDISNDPYVNQEWGLTKIQAAQAWGITKGSENTRIAILDTGIDVDHPDLAGKIVASVNFTDSPTADANGQSHGTHVAGTAAAITNNGIGIAGLAPNVSLMNVKVLGDSGYGYYSWIAQGIIWAADNGAEVINLSLGGSVSSATLEAAVNYAWNKGAVVVAAAGNNGSSAAFYPAFCINAIAVGATNANDNLTSWSNYGSWVDVAAPGESIYSSLPDGHYGYKSGTSMASPHVAGLAGLVFSVVSDSNSNGRANDEVRSRIEANCDKVAINVAFGRINAYKAVQGYSITQATPTPTVATTPTPTPTPKPTTTPAPTATPLPTPTSTPRATAAPTPAPMPTITPAPTSAPTPRPSVAPTPTIKPTPVPTINPTPALSPTLKPAMWIDSITFTPVGPDLAIKIKVVNPAPVKSAWATVEIKKDGSLITRFSGTSGYYGELTYTIKSAANGGYQVTTTGLTHSKYVWDKTKGITSNRYSLNK